LKVIVNHLNEALFLRAEDGKLGYCNELGRKFIHQASKDVSTNNRKLDKYLNSLGSTDFLQTNYMSSNSNDSRHM